MPSSFALPPMEYLRARRRARQRSLSPYARHAEQLSDYGDEVGRHAEKRSCSRRGRLVFPEPRKENEGEYDGESVAAAMVSPWQRRGAEQRPACAEEPSDEP